MAREDTNNVLSNYLFFHVSISFVILLPTMSTKMFLIVGVGIDAFCDSIHTCVD